MEKSVKAQRKANDLSGSDWTKFSISVWNDIRKSTDERRLKHPALFPISLATRLIKCFTTEKEDQILDPFMGSGSTLMAAFQSRKTGIGFEISQEYINLAKRRISQGNLFSDVQPIIHQDSATNIQNTLEKNSVDLCITSPPYWNILSQKRTADNKEIRDYGDNKGDLSQIDDYWEFLDELVKVFQGVFYALKPEKYCIVNVMDLRKKSEFFPFHSDLATKMVELGYKLDDIIIWDRRNDYNNLRSLGYPYVFRLNKVHEYLMIFQKPSE